MSEEEIILCEALGIIYFVFVKSKNWKRCILDLNRLCDEFWLSWTHFFPENILFFWFIFIYVHSAKKESNHFFKFRFFI